MKKIVPMNPMPDGSCRTIKANASQVSIANLMREGAYACTGVKEYEEEKNDKRTRKEQRDKGL